MTQVKSISLIVPTFKQGKILLDDIDNLKKSLVKTKLNYEIIVVADGLLKQVEKIINHKSSILNLRVIGYDKNKGKGFAVKYGMLKAKGDVVGFIDAGLDLDPNGIIAMLKIMEQKNADIVIGSKTHKDSKINYPLFRKILSSGYRSITHLLFGFSVRDTQVGLKIFRKNVSKDIFSKIKTKGFAFDVEVLALAYRLGYRKIYEAPIKVNFKHNTINYLNSLKIVFSMLIETMSIFYRLKFTNSYNKGKS